MFGTEFVALQTASDLIIAIRYKLGCLEYRWKALPKYFVITVVKNTSVPESVLTKKHNAVNYHVVREAAAAADVLEVHKEDTVTIFADLFTTVLSAD